MIGNGDAVDVGAEITQHLIGSPEGWFAIDHPVASEKLAEKTSEQLGLSEALQEAVELELSGSPDLFQCVPEFPAEDLAENCFREKEIVTMGPHPAGVIGRQAAGRHDAVNVGMMLQLLVPGVQDTEEADLGAEALWVCGDLQKCLSAAAEQQAIDDVLVLKSERPQVVRQREDHMSITGRQQFRAACRQPVVAGPVLAFRTMPIAAGIVRDGAMAAA